MPTHDYIIANGTGAAVRADINAALSAIVSLNSSASEPGTMYAYQLWADTTSNLLKIRNSANSAWITLRQLDGDFSIVAVEDGLQATPSLTFTNDLNTGIFRPGNDSLSIVTNALRAITITSTQAVGIQTANPSTALHVAGNARVGADDTTDAHLQIGKGATGNRNSYIDIVGDTTYTDYGVRLIRNNGGADATSEIKHRGTGAFNIVTQEAAPIQFYTSNSPRVAIDSSGRLLVGTSTARTDYFNNNLTAMLQVEGTNSSGAVDRACVSIVNNNNVTVNEAPVLILGRSNGPGLNSKTLVSSGTRCGYISFQGADGSDLIDAASIAGEIDGTPGANNMPGRLVFSTTADGASSPTERARITNLGALKASTTGGYSLASNAIHELRSNQNNRTVWISNTNAGPYGLYVKYEGADPNGTDNEFLVCDANGTVRASIRSNGGLANFSANNANLSDRNAKKDITPATGTWDCLKQWEIVNYRYKDQPDDSDLNLGVIAQQVAESCPEVITVFQKAKEATEDQPAQEERLGVKEQQMYWMAIKALQEAQVRIEQLEAKVAALESA